MIPMKRLKNHFEMPVFGLGTWQMGGRKEHDPNNDDKADIAAIKSAIDHGVTHIDTAESYAAGYTETLVAQAIRDHNRSKLFLVSKVRAENFAYDDILRACDASLKRLGTSYLDLYLLHRYNADIPLKDSMRALDALVDRKLVKYIGVSNFGHLRLAEAQSYTSNKIVCDQVHYNLIVREPEKKGLLQYCQENDVFLNAWRPVEKGVILNNIPPIFQEICNKYKKTPAQVAINWLISQPYVLTLSKTRDAKHLEENLGATGWEMEVDDIERLRRDFPNQRYTSDVVSLG